MVVEGSYDRKLFGKMPLRNAKLIGTLMTGAKTTCLLLLKEGTYFCWIRSGPGEIKINFDGSVNSTRVMTTLS